jgi:hypothetical protein
MDLNKFILFIFLLLIKISFQKNTFLTFNFKNNINKTKIKSSSYYIDLSNNNFVTNINLGTPKQTLPLTIKFHLSSLAITSTLSIKNEFIIKYNLNKSSSYQSENFTSLEFGIDEFNKGIKSQENFELNDKIKVNNLNFILTTETYSEVSGILGLNIKYDKDILENYSTLKQFKERNLISNCIFFFNFNDNNDNSPLNYNGQLIIGTYPHEYNPKKYKKENYFEIKVKPQIDKNSELYEVKFLEIYYGNNNEEYDFTEEIISNIDASKTFIQGTTKFKKFITEEFKKLYNDKCKEVIFRLIVSFSCDQDIDINKLKSIYIYNSNVNYTFVLNPSDLFSLYDNKLYFLITFKTYATLKNWTFGTIFLKKYNLVFDQESKVVGYYDNKNDIINNSFYFKVILSFCFLMIVIFSLLMFYYKILSKKRKIRANELDENIDYTPYKSINV